MSKHTQATFLEKPVLHQAIARDLYSSELPSNLELFGDRPSRPFINSIRDHGVLEPILVRELPRTGLVNRNYEVLDGRRRIMAWRAVKEDYELRWEQGEDMAIALAPFATIPAMIYNSLDDYLAHEMALIGNTQRSANIVSDLQSIKALLLAGKSPEGIRKQTGMSASTYAARCQLLKLSSGLMQALEKKEISSNLATAASKLTPLLQEQLLERLEGEGKLTATALREIRSVASRAATDELQQAVFDSNEEAIGYIDKNGDIVLLENSELAGIAKQIEELKGKIPKYARRLHMYLDAIIADAEFRQMKGE
jgi:ParB-like chromosome segregation protein Spo0J